MIADTDLSPIGFVEDTLGLPLYPWQDKAIAPLSNAGWGKPLVQITALAPNEGGKSSRIVAGSSLWWLYVHARGKVAITTKDSKQLNEQVIPAIEAQIIKFEGWKSVRSPYYRVTTPSGGSIVAYTTADANRVEGFHGSPDSPLLYIVDEAKSVIEPIFTGIDRCGYQALLYCSSGGLAGFGSFWHSHEGDTQSSFIKVRAGLIDCPHIPKSKVDRIIQKHGIDNPFTRSCVFGEFMLQADTDEYCVSLKALLNCLESPPKHRPGLKAGFCDFGAGTAEHVLAVRDGNKIEIAAAWIEANKDATAGRFIREFRKAGLTPEQVYCDASDKEIWTKLANAGWPIRRQNFGAPARLGKEYISWGAEAWLEGSIKIASHEVILPDDGVLKAQMIDRKKGFNAAGKLKVEDKLEMQKRNVPSPDRADAVFGVMSLPERIEQKDPFPSGWSEQNEHAEEFRVASEIGAFAGL